MVMPPSGFASWLNRQPTPASNIRPVNTPTNRRDLEGIRGMAQQRLMMPSISQGYRLPAPPPPQSSPAIPSPPSVSSVAPQEHFMRVLPPSPPPQEPTIYQKINQSHMDRGRTEWMPRTVTTGEWDEEKNKCFAGFTVSGDNVGVNESISVSGEALSFLSTGIDTRVYFIKNF